MLGTSRLARLAGAALPVMITGLLAVPVTPAQAAAGDVSLLLTLTNTVRAAAGSAPLTLDPALSSIAAGWAQSMAAAGNISHNPNLKAQIEGAFSDWRKTGENVGFGPTLQSVQDALVASAGHYHNMVDGDFTKVGLAVLNSGGLVWIVEVFLSVSASPAPAPDAAPAPDPAPAPAPRQVATTEPPPPPPTTTEPPTTTTTTTIPPTTTTVVLPPPSPGLPLQLTLMLEQLKAIGTARR